MAESRQGSGASGRGAHMTGTIPCRPARGPWRRTPYFIKQIEYRVWLRFSAHDRAVSAPPSTGPMAKKPLMCAARQGAAVALVRKKCATCVPMEWHTSVAGMPPAWATARSTSALRSAYQCTCGGWMRASTAGVLLPR